MLLSVIICTYRPRPDSWQKTLEALAAQTLPTNKWELVVVANGDTQLDLAHIPEVLRPATRIISEPELGLTPARLCGIWATSSDLLVFVDDDNVLDPEYLGESLALAERHPQLGAFGGWATPVYETEPAPSLRIPADETALKRDIDKPRWSNLYDASTSPFGAGMVVRRAVAERYRERTTRDSPFYTLDRAGDLPAFCGDTDLAWTAIDIGMGCGIFPSLHFLHLAPANRVTLPYLLGVAEGFTCSWLILHRLRGLPLPAPRRARSRVRQILDRWRYLRSSPTDRAFARARWRGEDRALGKKM